MEFVVWLIYLSVEIPSLSTSLSNFIQYLGEENLPLLSKRLKFGDSTWILSRFSLLKKKTRMAKHNLPFPLSGGLISDVPTSTTPPINNAFLNSITAWNSNLPDDLLSKCNLANHQSSKFVIAHSNSSLSIIHFTKLSKQCKSLSYH